MSSEQQRGSNLPLCTTLSRAAAMSKVPLAFASTVKLPAASLPFLLMARTARLSLAGRWCDNGRDNGRGASLPAVPFLPVMWCAKCSLRSVVIN
jgi:hypothetical protein